MVPRVKGLILPLTLLLGLIPFFLLGMGGMGPDIPTHIPKPVDKLTVAVTDVQGTRTILSQFSLDSTTFLSGQMGAGTMSIPFMLIREVTIIKREGAYIAEAVTSAGTKVELEVKGSSRILGKVEIGNYSIYLKEVRRLEILR